MSVPPVGQWEVGFDHALSGTGTDPTVPFQGAGFVPPPTPPAVGQNATQNFFWGQGKVALHARPFNAVHMALIPKGPNQGKVMVWGAWWPVRMRPSTALDPSGDEWFFQAWSIIDPDPTSSPRIENFLQPLAAIPATHPPTIPSNYIEIQSLFCTGHAWSHEGDLVIVGGASALVPKGTVPPFVAAGYGTGAKFMFLFDPARQFASFPATSSPTTPLYPGFGMWLLGPQLLLDRWYPTVTLTQQLSRNGLNNEVVMISGGDDLIGGSTAEPRENYETYVVRDSGAPSGFLTQDPDPFPFRELAGPDSQSGTVALTDEWLDEYPRLHLISDNSVFHSGPPKLSSKVQQDVLAQPFVGGRLHRPWNLNVGRNPTPWWDKVRHDGSSVYLFSNGMDTIARLGGADQLVGGQATDTAEFCVANGAATWTQVGTIPGGPRQYLNCVVLPDASILVIGGFDPATLSYAMPCALFRPGIGWVPVVDTPSRRGYHATAVLLPDGRVFVGGGELINPDGSPSYQNGPGISSEHDYDILRPHYLDKDPLRPIVSALTDVQGNPIGMDPTGSARVLDAGSQYRIECDDIKDWDQVSRLSLIAPGSITHHSDMSARFVDVTGQLLAGENAIMQFQIPAHGAVPRGFYMLFALNSAGTPSKAMWVKVR